MNSYYGLSEIEYELMQLFWQSDKELFFGKATKNCFLQKSSATATNKRGMTGRKQPFTLT